MALKRGIQDIGEALPPRKRRSSRKASQNEDHTPVYYPPQPVQGQVQQPSEGTLYSSSVDTDFALYQKALGKGGKDEVLLPLKEQLPQEKDQIESVQGGNQPAKLPLTRESLRLLNQSNRSPSLSMSTKETQSTAESDASNTSVNAYHENFERYLRYRSIYLIKDQNNSPPKNLEAVRSAVFRANKAAKPPKDQARIVRDISMKVTGEPDVVSRLLPRLVPLTQFDTDTQKEYVVDKFWHHCLSVEPEKQPRLKIPKPDVTIGWSLEVFPFPRAERFLNAFQFPVASSTDLSWPLFTIEAKGGGGRFRVAQLQNLYNASIMLSNLRELTKAAGREDEFFNKIHVMTLEVTTDIVQLSYYWATRSENGKVSYYGDYLESWALRNRRDTHFVEAYQCIHNAINLVTQNAFKLVYECMETVEKIHDVTNTINISPPRTLSKKSGVRKTRGKKASTSQSGTSVGASSIPESQVPSDKSQGSDPKEQTTEREEPRENTTVIATNPASGSSLASLATYVIQSINPFQRRQAL